MSKILIVEDDKNALLGLSEILKDEGYEVEAAEKSQDALDLFNSKHIDLVLSDFMLPDFDGMELMAKIRRESSDSAFVMMTAFGSVRHAVEALKTGADNYLTKPIDLDELLIIIKKVLNEKAIRKENESLKDKIQTNYKFDNIIGVSGKMQDVFKKVTKIAVTDTTVLIRGESGTGKELIARALHFNSHRKSKELVEVNCASIPETLLESELFGHEKGSFTGAHKQKIGKFEQANGGSIFLDEIGEISLSVQAKLLRVLQERRFNRVGGNDLVEVDVRVIAATNADLEQLMQEGEFRDDLYYRLNVIPMQLPALRERKEDIAPLINFFVKKVAKKNALNVKNIESDFYNTCEKYYWPGNIRELENAIENAFILCETDSLSSKDLPPYITNQPKELNLSGSILLDHLPLKQQLDMAEKIIIEKALAECNGNKTHAAKQMGFSIRTMRNKVNKYGIES
jgi:two-component system, NtrC family, response regulator AtoC